MLQKVTWWRSLSAFSTSWKQAANGIYFLSHLSSQGRFWATRACMPISASGRGTANGKRFGAWCWAVTGFSWTCPVWIWTAATPPRFAVGSVVKGACSTGSIPHKPVGRDGTISHLYWFFWKRYERGKGLDDFAENLSLMFQVLK